MGPSALIKTLCQIIPTRQNIWIHGEPGIGKTDIVHQVADHLGLKCPPIPPAVVLDPVDVNGCPSIVNGVTVFNPPDFLPAGDEWGEGVIFLDEFGQAAQPVQAAFLQYLWGGLAGKAKKPKDATVIVCSNRRQDKAGVARLITPMKSRFVHLDLEVDYHDWNLWAIQNNILPELRGAIKFKTDLLMNFDPDKDEKTFSCPRTLSILNNLLPRLTDDTMTQVAEGTVGAAAHEIIAFIKTYRDLPDPDEVIKKPEKAVVPTEPSTCIALCMALASRCKGADDKKLGQVMKYVDRLPAEYSTLLVRDAAIINDRITVIPEAVSWMKKHRAILYPQGGFFGGK